MNFGQALTHLRAGRDVARAGWNGKGMWVGLGEQSAELSVPFLFLHTATGEQVPWTISQTDALADDWETTGGTRAVGPAAPAPEEDPVYTAARAVVEAFAHRPGDTGLVSVLLDPMVALDEALTGRT